MGISIAEVAADLGFDVTLVVGPVNTPIKNNSIKVIKVISAKEMAEQCILKFPANDITILSAAVADFTPENYNSQKIKNKENRFSLELVPTLDIAENLGKIKKENQILVGFALETENEISNAKKKLFKKNLDVIILNSLNDENAGFGFDTNKITIIDKFGKIDKFGLKSKDQVAKDIIEKIISIM